MPDRLTLAPTPTEFEQLATQKGIPPEQWPESQILRKFATKNKNRVYIPESLLELWDLHPTADDL
jgi:hypothetical protein